MLTILDLNAQQYNISDSHTLFMYLKYLNIKNYLNRFSYVDIWVQNIFNN